MLFSATDIGLTKEIDENGFGLRSSLIPAERIKHLLDGFSRELNGVHARTHDGETYALRNILKVIPEVAEIAMFEPLLDLVKASLGDNSRPVKAILFDKTEKTNWHLRWHQDNVIAVEERIEAPGYHGWSEKAGIPHVRPPVEILQQMLAARIHIDDCPVENGALKVIPKSHKKGRLDDAQLQKFVSEIEPEYCTASSGDVLFMKPLLLHASGRAEKPQHRRILHIEYAASDLPHGLKWGQ